MRIPKIFIGLSIAAGILMAVASQLGIADPRTYKKETVNWAAQAVGQDYVNLCLVFPVLLLASMLFLRRNSIGALLVWLGALLYMIYSYVLYSFFIHFGPLFPLYVATLSLSFYSFVGVLVTWNRQGAPALFAAVKVRPASILLGAVAVLFALLWLSDIVQALAGGGIPADLDKVGLCVNPVHVLDLGFLLPGALIISILLWRRKTLGLILAVPLLVFFVLMGVAILSMMIVTAQKGFPWVFPQMAAMGIVIAANAWIAVQFLRKVRSDMPECRSGTKREVKG